MQVLKIDGIVISFRCIYFHVWVLQGEVHKLAEPKTKIHILSALLEMMTQIL